MRKTISTSMTFFWKFIFSSVWIIGFGSGAIVAFSQKLESGIFVIGIWLATSFTLFFTVGSAKKVSIDDNYLCVSNYYKTNKINLSNISKITENKFFSPRMVFIHFNDPAYFGRKIHFLAQHEIFQLFNEHRVVKEIQNRIKAKSKKIKIIIQKQNLQFDLIY